MNNKDLAKRIVELVGGEENILILTHCATRLRFNLKDDNKADINTLKGLEGVLTAQEKSGQLQVVIGAKVNAIFDEVSAIVHITENSNIVIEKKNKNKVSAVIETISGIFAPTLPVLIGCGMIKAIVSLLTSLQIMDATNSFIVVLSMIGDLIFYFFPFFIAVSAAKKFKVSEFMAIALAGAYMYPTIMNGAAAIASGGPSSMLFLGMPILFVRYSSTVIPIILSVWVMSLIYNKIDRIIPDFLKILLTAMAVLLIMVPLELIVLGPIGSYAGTYIARFMDWFYNVGGFAAAALLGGTRSLLTMLGMHYALSPLQIQQIAETGVSTLLVSALTANFSQGGAALGSCLAIKDKKEKSVAASAALSAFLGITEPAMYAVNLKYKKPFVFAMISSAIAAAFLSFFHAGAMTYAPPGLFTIITYTADSFVFIIIGVLIAVVLSAVLSFFFGIPKAAPVTEDTEKADTDSKPENDSSNEVIEILSPMNGEVKKLSEVPDEAFSSGAMGKGVAIVPSEGKVYAPVDGKVAMLFPTKHAIGMVNEAGVEILIHIGLDTVELNGAFFTTHVKDGDSIRKGQLLIEFDKEEIEKKYNMITPVLITNGNNFTAIDEITGKMIGIHDCILKLHK